MNAPNNPDEVRELISKLAMELGEHFESVRIFVSYKSESGTGNSIGVDCGNGNLYSQLGQVREWLICQDEYARDHARKQANEDEAS